MKIIGAVAADVSANFFHSFGEHSERQHHAPEDFDYDQAAAGLAAAQANLTAASANIVTNTDDLAALAIVVAAKADQTTVAALTTVVGTNETTVDTLTAVVGTKGDQATLDEVNELAGDLDKFINVPTKTLVHEDDHIIKAANLRVEAIDDPAPTDSLPAGLFFTKGCCSENLTLLDDGRVDGTFSFDDPAENDNSTLRSTFMFGGQNGQSAADRHTYDGVTLVGQERFDDGGSARADEQQTHKQTLFLRASPDQANIYIESRGKNNNVHMVDIRSAGNNAVIIDKDGILAADEARVTHLTCNTIDQVNAQEDVRFTLDDNHALKFYGQTPNQATDNYNLRLNANGADGFFRIIMDKSAQSASDYITVRRGTGNDMEILNVLGNDGTWRIPPGTPVVGQPSRTNAAQGGSSVYDPNSVYIGNSRYSYDMSNRLVQLHKLKDDHIPVYLQAHVSENDLPSGHGLEHMTINKWVDFARTHLSDDALNVHDVFPYTNADWDTADAPNPTLTAAYNAMSTDLTTAENDIDANEAAIGRMSNPRQIYVDVSRTETYTESGSKENPFKTLQGAMSEFLVVGATTDYIFILSPGVYNVGSGIDLQMGSTTQAFAIEGCEGVEIRASSITDNIFYLRAFKSVTFRKCRFKTGKYGLYTRQCLGVTVIDCTFLYLGSTGSPTVHNFANTQAQQANHWAGTNTSDGGAMRLREASVVVVKGNYVWRCLRGIRIQDVGHSTLNLPSLIAHNRINETLESAIYLANGNYQFDNNGVYGCSHVTVTGNRIQRPYNNGILVVASKYCDISNNQIFESANAGIQQWHSVDCTYKGNYLFGCNAIEHNGIGNLGDAWGNIVIDGNAGIGTTSGEKIGTVIGNTTVKAGQGRAASVINIRLSVTYPGTAYEFLADLNTSDAADQLFNPASETVVTQFYRKSEVDALVNSIEAPVKGFYLVENDAPNQSQNTAVQLPDGVNEIYISTSHQDGNWYFKMPVNPPDNCRIVAVCGKPSNSCQLTLYFSVKFYPNGPANSWQGFHGNSGRIHTFIWDAQSGDEYWVGY